MPVAACGMNVFDRREGIIVVITGSIIRLIMPLYGGNYSFVKNYVALSSCTWYNISGQILISVRYMLKLSMIGRLSEMPQKIDVHGLFLAPESITDLMLQKRISVSYPVFHEVARAKSLFRRDDSSQVRILQFDHQEPYGIILADVEQPDSASYVVNYQQAIIDKIFKGISRVGKNLTGHISELLKIEISGDRQCRIRQKLCSLWCWC